MLSFPLCITYILIRVLGMPWLTIYFIFWNSGLSFLIFFFVLIARAALLTGRLPIRNGFYTTNAHARNG